MKRWLALLRFSSPWSRRSNKKLCVCLNPRHQHKNGSHASNAKVRDSISREYPAKSAMAVATCPITRTLNCRRVSKSISTFQCLLPIWSWPRALLRSTSPQSTMMRRRDAVSKSSKHEKSWTRCRWDCRNLLRRKRDLTLCSLVNPSLITLLSLPEQKWLNTGPSKILVNALSLRVASSLNLERSEAQTLK